MTTTSAAVPGWLLRYGEEATALDDELATRAATAAEAVRSFAATAPELVYPRHDPAADTRRYALANWEVDTWVRRVGEQFRRADLAARVAGSAASPPSPP